MVSILVCVEEEELINNLKSEFDKYNIKFDLVRDGISAKETLDNGSYKAVIIKDNLKGLDGITLSSYIRKKNNEIFIYILGSRNLDYDVFYALKSGANDYIVSPLNIENLALKVYNFLSLNGNQMLHVGNIDIDSDARVLYVDGKKKNLTLKEFKLLKYLIDNKGKAVSREEIFKCVWEYDDYALDDRTIDTHIKMLRNELGPYKDYIETYRGYGYKFEVK